MDGAEFSIGARIPEVEGKLARLCLDLQGIRPWQCEIDVGPRFLAKDTKREDFGTHQNERARDHCRGSAGKVGELRPVFALRKLPDEKGEDELSKEKRDPRLSHGV